ncbi:hypothetical protein ALC60_09184 [Trachymyrmex zeteki]|uniref:BED-type domain-containing protein n=1 Tax=Mycetomoellerius zeteki TaxID=64791 RepID=A0A151WV32_9HYME|nr:hypothetical protein ALC60_09184 [Trachymyrmex zeteki]
MREHYTKLTRNRAECNHCNTKFGIHTTHLYKLHKHLIETHPDKLTEEEKNEVKFHWAWDYYITGSNKDATCKLCKVTVRYQDASQLKRHLKRHHEISGPTSDNVIDNEESSSDDDIDANKDITLRKAKRCNHCNAIFRICITHLNILHNHLIEAHPDKLAEEEKNEVKFYWIWDYYITESNTEATCKLCKVTVKSQNITSLKYHFSRNHE